MQGHGKKRMESFVGEKFKVEKIIGEGGFCVVMRGRDMDTQGLVAIKRTDKTKPVYKKFKGPDGVEKINELMRREASVMRALDHPNLMKVLDYIDNGRNIYIVLEFAEGGELFNKVVRKGRLTEKESRMIIMQVCTGIKFMHDKGFVHRDIKAENILFYDKTNNSKIVITDFGLSRTKKDKMFTNCGTIVYSAPELLLNKTTKEGYDHKVDNWSIGVLAYFIMSGRLPFGTINNNENEIKRLILTAKFSFGKPPWGLIAEPAKEFIRALLTQSPQTRMEMEDALDHFWISQIERPKLIHMDVFPGMEIRLKITLAVVRWRLLISMGLLVQLLTHKYPNLVGNIHVANHIPPATPSRAGVTSPNVAFKPPTVHSSTGSAHNYKAPTHGIPPMHRK